MANFIRPFHFSDLVSLYQICLKTGDSGEDATKKYNNPNLLGHFYAAPYAVLEPELCFVLSFDGKPSGYILGTKDSQSFYSKAEKEWFPLLREEFPLPKSDDKSYDANIIRLIHKGHLPNSDMIDYPAHLHIDILPEGQGIGMGRKIMDTFLNKLRELKVPAVHLEVGKKNLNAISYYKHLGFHLIKEYEYSIALGMKLTD